MTKSGVFTWVAIAIAAGASYFIPDSWRPLIPIALLGGAVGFLYNRSEELSARVEDLERWKKWHIEDSERYRRYLSTKFSQLEGHD